MNDFSVEKYNNKILYGKTKFGNTLTYIKTSESFPNQKTVDFEMYDENNCRANCRIAFLYTEIYNHHIKIIDVNSKYENMGNGKLLFKHLIEFSKTITTEYYIEYINGFLSSIDFDHWDKLLHFYSTLGLEFTLNKPYKFNHVINNLSKYENNNINFTLKIP